jgi:hypothetical protein
MLHVCTALKKKAEDLERRGQVQEDRCKSTRAHKDRE